MTTTDTTPTPTFAEAADRMYQATSEQVRADRFEIGYRAGILDWLINHRLEDMAVNFYLLDFYTAAKQGTPEQLASKLARAIADTSTSGNLFTSAAWKARRQAAVIVLRELRQYLPADVVLAGL